VKLGGCPTKEERGKRWRHSIFIEGHDQQSLQSMPNRYKEILKRIQVAPEIFQKVHSGGRRSQPDSCSRFAGIHDFQDKIGKVCSITASVRCGKEYDPKGRLQYLPICFVIFVCIHECLNCVKLCVKVETEYTDLLADNPSKTTTYKYDRARFLSS
jgi:hypothetical protein